MIGDRERHDAPLSGENHVTSDLPLENPAPLLKNSSRLPAETTGSSGNCDLNLDGPYCQRQALFGANFEATKNRFMNVGQGLRLGSALTDAPGNSRALGDQHSSFVSFKRHGEFHAQRIPSGNRPGALASPADVL